MRYKYVTMEYYWSDLDTYHEKPITGAKRLWKELFNRALNDLTFQGQKGDQEMQLLADAYEFITVDNPAFFICCEVMNFAESHIKALREFAEVTFRANYKAPSVKEWKRKGRKPRGYVEDSAAENRTPLKPLDSN